MRISKNRRGSRLSRSPDTSFWKKRRLRSRNVFAHGCGRSAASCATLKKPKPDSGSPTFHSAGMVASNIVPCRCVFEQALQSVGHAERRPLFRTAKTTTTANSSVEERYGLRVVPDVADGSSDQNSIRVDGMLASRQFRWRCQKQTMHKHCLRDALARLWARASGHFRLCNPKRIPSNEEGDGRSIPAGCFEERAT